MAVPTIAHLSVLLFGWTGTMTGLINRSNAQPAAKATTAMMPKVIAKPSVEDIELIMKMMQITAAPKMIDGFSRDGWSFGDNDGSGIKGPYRRLR